MAHRLTPTNALEFHRSEVHEVYVDLEREALEHIAKDAEVLIVRVQVFGPSGRPSTRTLRLPTQLLKEPPPDTDWEVRTSFE